MALSATACLEGGDVAKMGCPVNEECSESTPDGLHFQGAWFAEGLLPGLKVIAEGGTQTIRVVTGNSDSSPGFALPFDARFDGSEVGVESVAGPSVVLTGKEAGFGKLRILEPDTEIIFDRVTIEVAPVTHVEIEPRSIFRESDVFGDGQQDSWALLEGGSIAVIVRLYNGETRLVDQSMTIEGGVLSGWDQTDVSASSGDVTLSVELGNDSRYDITVPVVSALDEIGFVGDTWDPSMPAYVGDSSILCLSGANAGRPVAGIEWDIAPNSELELNAFANCVDIRGLAEGEFPLVVSAGGLSTEYMITVLPRDSAALAPEFPLMEQQSSAGERAAAMR